MWRKKFGNYWITKFILEQLDFLTTFAPEYGVAKLPQAKHLALAVQEFLLRVEICAWKANAAEECAKLRSAIEKEGKSLSAMDILIAAHSIAEQAILITSDKAFYQLKQYPALQDWT